MRQKSRSRRFGHMSVVEGIRLFVNSESLYDAKPLVQVKGTRDGLLFVLDEEATVDDLCNFIEHLLSGEFGRVFDGPHFEVIVDYGRRTLVPTDAQRILQCFMSRPNFVVKSWGGFTSTRQALHRKYQRTQKQIIYRGVVRSGEPVSFDGDVVLIGDVNPSGEIQATGDIYVFGRLLGVAHAGIAGNDDSIIAATEFAPMQLRISDVISRAPSVDDHPIRAFMEFAYLENGQLAVAQMKHFASLVKTRQRRQRVDERENSE